MYDDPFGSTPAVLIRLRHKAMNPILLNFRITCHERELFRLSLRDEHAVERVKVYRRQFTCTIAMFQRDFQGRKSMAFDFFKQCVGCVEFAERFL